MSKSELENARNRCRICFEDNIKICIDLNDKISEETGALTYCELFCRISRQTIRDFEPQKLCQKCAGDLVLVGHLIQRANKTQILLENLLKLKDDSWDNDKNDILSESEDRIDIFVEEFGIKSEPESKVSEFNCEICEKSFRTHEGHYQHMLKKHKAEPEILFCEFCRLTFRGFGRLQSHLKKCKCRPRTDDERLNDKNLHVCPICGNLSSADHIRNHTKTAKKDSSIKKSFICDICGITVSTRSNIDMHMKVQHLNIRSKCRHCPGNFKNPSALARHMRKSHSEKLQDYRCRTCDFRTSVEKEARNHRESHRLKKLVCHECGQAFLKTINLKYHMASHSDKRPYACDTCGSAFKTTKALGAHKKTHRTYDYECPVCSRSYLTNQLMRSHVEKNHPEYELPPPGTVFSKSYRQKMAERQLKEMAIKQGIDVSQVNKVIVPEDIIQQVQSIHVVR